MRDSISVRSIAWKNMSHHKGRTLLTIFTTALSVALVLVVFTYFHSEDNRNKRAAINEIGAFHVQYEDLSVEQQQLIISNPKMKKHYLSYNGKNIHSPTFEKSNIHMAIGYMEGINHGLLELRRGRTPEADYEIVLDEWVLHELGYASKIGQKISLELQVTSDDQKKEMTKTFELVGITEDIAIRKAARAGLMFVSKGFLEQYSPDSEVTVFALLKSNINATSVAQKIGQEGGLSDKQIKINERYTGAYEQNQASILQSVLAVLVIILSSGMVVYNIFNIYISQQIRLFGVMKAIGMTPRQLRRMILIEGLIISFIGSSVGILLGIGCSLAFIPFLGNTGASDSSLYVEVSPLYVGAAFLLGVLFVILAIQFPARRVGKITEIAAIRYNPVADVWRARNTTRSKLNNSLSSFALVSAQVMRHRKRTWITITSITLIGLIFIVTSSILNSMNVGNVAASMVPGDYKLSVNSYRGMDEHLDLLDGEFVKRIQDMNGIQSVFTEMYDEFIYNKQDAAVHLNRIENIRNPNITSEIYGYDDALMQKTLHALGNNAPALEEMKKGNLLIAIAEDGSYKIGDKIRMTPLGEQQAELEFTIVDVLPSYFTYKGDSAYGGTLIAHQDLFKRLGLDQRIKQLSVTVAKQELEQVEQRLREIAIADQRIGFTSFQEIYQEFHGAKRLIEISAYGFITTLLIISVLNLVNSNLTSMIARKREISLIEAIGLSRVQLATHLGSEGVVVVLVSLLLTFILGIPAGYIIVELFKHEATYAEYQFPIGAMLILIAAYMAVQMLTTYYMHRRLSKESLIERIRFSE